MANYQAERWTLAIMLVIMVIIIFTMKSTKDDPLSGFNIAFDYSNPNYNGTVTIGQLYAANQLGITNFRWVESVEQQQKQSMLENVANIMYDDPEHPYSMQKFDTFYTGFINGTCKLMISIPYNDKNDPRKWLQPTSKGTQHIVQGTGQTLPMYTPLTDFSFINRIEFSLMQKTTGKHWILTIPTIKSSNCGAICRSYK